MHIIFRYVQTGRWLVCVNLGLKFTVKDIQGDTVSTSVVPVLEVQVGDTQNSQYQ